MAGFLAMFSAGAVSWAAAKRIALNKGRDGIRLLFADTLIEDEDAYRFLVDGAANVFGMDLSSVSEISAMAWSIPPVESLVDGGPSWDDRVDAIAAMRIAAAEALPGLVWIADGREPWEVYEDERYIGNGFVDPCSKHLKRRLMDRWRAENVSNWETTLVFGLDWSERGRIDGANSRGRVRKGHRERMAEMGWRSAYPMNERPYLTKPEILDWMRSEGLEPPRLYALGFPFNNCGGFCCKMGLGQATLLLEMMPGRFAWHERRQEDVSAAIGPTAVPFLVKQRDGVKRRLTLREHREMVGDDPSIEADGWGCGGGCAVDDDQEDMPLFDAFTN